MPVYPNETVMICSVDDRDLAERMAVAMGHSPEVGLTFTVALSSDSGESITHYGTCAYVRDFWGLMIEQAKQGNVPDAPWSYVGLAPEDVSSLLNRMIVVTRPEGASGVLWRDVLMENDLIQL